MKYHLTSKISKIMKALGYTQGGVDSYIEEATRSKLYCQGDTGSKTGISDRDLKECGIVNIRKFKKFLKDHDGYIAGGFMLKAEQMNRGTWLGGDVGDVDVFINSRSGYMNEGRTVHSPTEALNDILGQIHTFMSRHLEIKSADNSLDYIESTVNYAGCQYCNKELHANPHEATRLRIYAVWETDYHSGTIKKQKKRKMQFIILWNSDTPICKKHINNDIKESPTADYITKTFDLSVCKIMYNGEYTYTANPDHVRRRIAKFHMVANFRRLYVDLIAMCGQTGGATVVGSSHHDWIQSRIDRTRKYMDRGFTIHVTNADMQFLSQYKQKIPIARHNTSGYILLDTFYNLLLSNQA